MMLIAGLFVQWAVVPAGSKISCLGVLGAEGGPRVGTVDLFCRDVVHSNGDPQHTGQGDEVRTDVAVDRDTVIGAPVCHDAVYIVEGALTGEPGANQVVGQVRSVRLSMMS